MFVWSFLVSFYGEKNVKCVRWKKALKKVTVQERTFFLERRKKVFSPKFFLVQSDKLALVCSVQSRKKNSTESKIVHEKSWPFDNSSGQKKRLSAKKSLTAFLMCKTLLRQTMIIPLPSTPFFSSHPISCH